MKIKHLLIGLFAVAATVACDQEEPVETPSLEVSQETLALDAKEDEASFDVTSNLAWTATADETWVHLDPSSADASKDPVTVTVTADDNTAEEARTAVITVKAGELTKTIELTQAAAEAEDPGDEPGDGDLEITALYVLGGACDTGWSIDAMTQFTLVEGVWVWEGNLKPDDGEGDAEAVRFPLQKVSGEFWPCLVPNADGTAVTYAEDEVENTFRVDTDGLYKITVNPETLAMTVERLGDRPESELVLYILGGAINENADEGWKLANMQTFENNNGIYTWTGHLRRDEFRFPIKSDWWPCYQISGEGLDNLSLVYGTSDADKTNYRVPQAGTYTITINLTDPESPTVELSLVEADQEAPVTYTVAGTLVQEGDWWQNAGPAGLMTLEGEYYVAKNLDFKWRSTCYDDSPNDNWFEFKICETGTWSAYGQGEGMNSANSVIDVSFGGNNIVVNSPEGTYDVYFDKANGKVWVMKAGYAPGDEVPEDEQPEPVDPSTIELYMLGSGCSTGWELNDMTKFENNNGILTWTGYLKPEEFRFPLQKVAGTWWPCYMISPDGQSLVLGHNDDDKVVYTVDYPATYTITINATDVENPTFTIEPVETALSLVGTLAGDNNGWNNTSEAGKMTWDGEYFVLQNAPLVWRSSIWGADENYFDFKVCALGTWDAFGAVSAGPHAANAAIDLTWGGTEIDVVAPEGNYDVYFDPAKRQIWFMTPGYKPGETPDLPQEPENPDYQVSELYMLGGACDTGWDLSMMTKFAKVGEDWVWEGNLKPGGDNEQFRFPLQKVSAGWWPCLVPNADGTAVILGTADGVTNTYRVPSEGYYKVTVTPLTGALSIERLDDMRAPSFITELYMLGGAVPEVGWTVANVVNEQFTNNGGIFTWEGELTAGEFRFQPQTFDYAPALEAAGEGKLNYETNQNAITNLSVAEAGTYTIVVDARDCNNITYTLTKQGPKVVTVAEFLAAEEDATEYQLTGVMEGTYNQTYGNFYLNDGTGKVCVYGLTATKVASNDRSFASLGLRDGDTVTLIGTRDDYNGTPQVGGPAYYVSHVAAPYVDFATPAATVEAEVTTYTIEVLSNAAWTATPSEGVTLDKTSGEGAASVVMTFAANATSEVVNHSVVFAVEGSTATFELNQKAVPVAGAVVLLEEDFTSLTAWETTDVTSVNVNNLTYSTAGGSMYKQKGCLKFGKSKEAANTGVKLPKLTSLTEATNVTLTFKAVSSDNSYTMVVSATAGATVGTLAPSKITKYAGGALNSGADTATNLANAFAQSTSEFSVTIENVTADTEISIVASGNAKRWYLDDVKILQN